MFRRQIPRAIVFTRTNAQIATREQKSIIEYIRERRLPHLTTKLSEHTAFSNMFWEKVGLDELDASQVNGFDKARANCFIIITRCVIVTRWNPQNALAAVPASRTH